MDRREDIHDGLYGKTYYEGEKKYILPAVEVVVMFEGQQVKGLEGDVLSRVTYDADHPPIGYCRNDRTTLETKFKIYGMALVVISRYCDLKAVARLSFVAQTR